MGFSETIGVFLLLMMLIYMLQMAHMNCIYPFFAQLPRFGEISHDLLVSESLKNSEIIHKWFKFPFQSWNLYEFMVSFPCHVNDFPSSRLKDQKPTSIQLWRWYWYDVHHTSHVNIHKHIKNSINMRLMILMIHIMAYKIDTQEYSNQKRWSTKRYIMNRSPFTVWWQIVVPGFIVLSDFSAPVLIYGTPQKDIQVNQHCWSWIRLCYFFELLYSCIYKIIYIYIYEYTLSYILLSYITSFNILF